MIARTASTSASASRRSRTLATHPRGCGRGDVHRIGHRRGAGQQSGEGGPGRFRERVDLQARTRAGVRSEHACSPGVADHSDPTPARQRLPGQQGEQARELGELVHRENARLVEQRVTDHARGRGSRRVRRGRATRGGRAPGSDRQDRLACGEAAGESRELPRTPQRLEVEHRRRRLRVRVPPGEQVVAVDVQGVARGNRRGDAEPQPVQRGGQRDGDATGLDGEADVTGAARGAEGGLQPHGGIGVHQSDAVGPDQPHAVTARAQTAVPRAAGARSRPPR